MKFEERYLEAENATEEQKRIQEIVRQRMIEAEYKTTKVPKLKGRIINDSHGIQAIQTDSKEEGKKIIHALGFTRVPNAKVGDYVVCEYRVSIKRNMAMWICKKVDR